MKPRPPVDLAAAAQAMSDAMLTALLSGFNPPSSILADVRSCFVSYCAAHPQFKDIRSAWSAFDRELKTELLQQPAQTPATTVHSPQSTVRSP